MAAMYQHKFTTPLGESPQDEAGELTLAGDTWSRGLSGLTDSQIGVGLNACLLSADEWPPSLPGFRAMCLSIPPLSEIRRQVKPGAADLTPFARLVWSLMDGWSYGQAQSDKADRMLREAYDEAREHVMRGGELPKAALAVTHDPRAEQEIYAKLHAERMAELLAESGATR